MSPDLVVMRYLECLKSQVGDSQDVRTAVIQESSVVRHHDCCNVCQRVDVVLDPGYVDDVQVICRLVQQQNVSFLKHGTCLRQS